MACCCRYIIRAQVSDWSSGSWASKDFELLVRKAGDTQGLAPCCRSTGLIIAQQLGRPIDSAVFRPVWINSSAAAVGWDTSYLEQPVDMEAERLFDYGILAATNTGEQSIAGLCEHSSRQARGKAVTFLRTLFLLGSINVP